MNRDAFLRLVLFLLTACPSDPHEAPPSNEPEAQEPRDSCLDEDGDGRGLGCEPGSDCDETDPDVWQGCLRCGSRPAEGCRCDATHPVECHSGAPVPDDLGRLRCMVGQRTCEAWVWSACAYTGSYLIDGQSAGPRAIDPNPASCSNCDPDCYQVGGTLAADDVGLENSNGVSWDAEAGGIIIDGQATQGGAFSYIASPIDGTGTVSKIRHADGVEVGRYYVGEEGVANSPSRTTIDGYANAYVANRTFSSWGSVTKIAGDQSFCQDRDADGAMDTSTDWTPLPIGTDECVLWTVRLGANGRSVPRAMAIDRGDPVDAPEGYIWVGTFYDGDNLENLGGRAYQLHPDDGRVLQTIALPIRAYGAVADNRDRQQIWFTTLEAGGGLVSVRVDDGRVDGPFWPNQPGVPYTHAHSGLGNHTHYRWGDGYGVTFDGQRIWQGGRRIGAPPAFARSFDIDTHNWCLVQSPVGGDRQNGIAVRMNDDGSLTVYAANKNPSALVIWDAERSCERLRTNATYCQGFTAGGTCTGTVTANRWEYWYPAAEVSQLALDGALYDDPKGVGLDLSNRVWVINNASDNIAVYDPEDGSIVEYPTTAGALVAPYTYSDFTGYQRARFTNTSGTFSQDYGVAAPVCPSTEDVTWGDLHFTGQVPVGSRISFEARTADDPAELRFATPVIVGEAPTDASPIYLDDALVAADEFSHYQYLRITAVLISDDSETTPVLQSMRVDWLCLDRT